MWDCTETGIHDLRLATGSFSKLVKAGKLQHDICALTPGQDNAEGYPVTDHLSKCIICACPCQDDGSTLKLHICNITAMLARDSMAIIAPALLVLHAVLHLESYTSLFSPS